MKTKEKYNIERIEEIDIDSANFFEINGNLYIEIQDQNNNKQLLKYNKKYNKMVVLQFMENCSMYTEEKIIEILSKQYIEDLIYKKR